MTRDPIGTGLASRIILAFLIVLLVLLAAVFGFVMFSDSPDWIFSRLGVSGTGAESPKYKALKFLGIGMGGTLVGLQAVMSYRRAKALGRSA